MYIITAQQGKIMTKLKATIIATMLLAAALLLVPTYTVKAADQFLWSEWVYSATGATVTSPVLEMGKTYRIVASEVFLYNQPANLAADAMYYTTDATNSWEWGNHFAAPGWHSFLQINGADVNWGPFSNGDTGHTYSITYTGRGRAINFRIVDWVDRTGCRSNYANNYCHLPVTIYLVENSGLTPGYWKNHVSAWPTQYHAEDRLTSIFGSNAPDVTLLQALGLPGGNWIYGAKQILARAATAALLNTAYFGSDYPMDATTLINEVTAAFNSQNRITMLRLAITLDYYNNL